MDTRIKYCVLGLISGLSIATMLRTLNSEHSVPPGALGNSSGYAGHSRTSGTESVLIRSAKQSGFAQHDHDFEKRLSDSRTVNNIIAVGFDDSETAKLSAQWLSNHLSDQILTPQHISDMIGQWSCKYPEDALEWCSTLPDDWLAHGLMIPRAVERLASLSPNSAASWLDRHRGRPIYDKAVLAFIGVIAPENLEAAALWADTISDPVDKTKAAAVIDSNGRILAMVISGNDVDFHLAPQPQ